MFSPGTVSPTTWERMTGHIITTYFEDPFEPLEYPFMATLSGNTPQAFEGALLQVKALLDEEERGHRAFNINCWNEWTEGSYLEPDTTNGLAYLEAIRAVFGTNVRQGE